MRKINELGLKKTYETAHDNLALASKCCLPLNLKKKKKTGDSFDMIVLEIQNLCDRNCSETRKMRKLSR